MTERSRIALLLPVKDLGAAKSRLAPLLTVQERQALAWLMLQGVLQVIAAVDHSGPRAIVTNYAPAVALAQESGFIVLQEARQVSESESVDEASAILARQGAEGVLRIPLDLPLLAPGDLQAVLDSAAEGAQCVLVPSRDGTGTNALYRSPPHLFASRFGSGSLELHERAARAAASDVRIVSLPGFALDIDDPSDVRELLRLGHPCPVLAYLRGLDLTARLARVADVAG